MMMMMMMITGWQAALEIVNKTGAVRVLDNFHCLNGPTVLLFYHFFQ